MKNITTLLLIGLGWSASAQGNAQEPIKISPQDTIVCKGQSVKLTLSYPPGVTNISWAPTSGLNCTACDNPLATPDQTTRYIVSGQQQGQTIRDTVLITVRTPVVFQFPDDKRICKGENIQLNNIADAAANYSWTSSDPNAGPITGAQPIIKPQKTTTYTVVASNGCSSQGDFTVTVVDESVQALGDTTICKGFTTQLTAIGSVPGTYSWLDELNGQNFTGQVVNVKPNSTTDYTLTYTTSLDKCVLTDRVRVTVSGEKVQIGFPFKTKLCPGEEVVLNSLDAPAGASYTWTSTPPGFSSSLPKPAVKPAASTTYRVRAISGGCVTQDTIRIIVDNATISVNKDTTVCEGERVTLKANSNVTGLYRWSFGATSVGNPVITVPVNQTTTYNLTFSFGDQNSCTLTASVKVTVTPGISELSLNATPPVDSSMISAYASNDISITAVVKSSLPFSNFRFQWTDEKGKIVSTSDKYDPPSDSVGVTEYKVLVTSNLGGCTKMLTVVVKILQDSLVLPNAFSPNNDRINDDFGLAIVDYIDRMDDKSPNPNPQIELLEIYNRWGSLVFQTVEKDPKKARWDGTIDGTEAPPDVYVYRVQYRRGDGSLGIKHGDVMLLR